MLLSHELRHEVVDADAYDFADWHSKHFLDVSGCSRNDAHCLSVYYSFNHAGSLMVYEFFELFQRIKVILLVSEVKLFQILSNLFSIIEKANLAEIEKEK